jgi:hypothetical protein
MFVPASPAEKNPCRPDIGPPSGTHEHAVRRSVILAASILPRPLRLADPAPWPGEIKQPRRQGNQQCPTVRVVGTLRKRKTLRRALAVKLNLTHRIPLTEQNKWLANSRQGVETPYGELPHAFHSTSTACELASSANAAGTASGKTLPRFRDEHEPKIVERLNESPS